MAHPTTAVNGKSVAGTAANGSSSSASANGGSGGGSSGGGPRSRSLTRGLSGIAALAAHNNPNELSAPTPRVEKTASMPGSTRGSGAVKPIPDSLASEAPVVGGAGYIDTIGLKLNEQVNKVCIGVDFKAKRGFKHRSGWQLGEFVVSQLPAPSSDAYLFRAVLRIMVRSLTIYISRLEYFLLPAVGDATFATPFNLTLAVPGATPFHPTQTYAISVCHAAWETCEVLEETLESKPYPKFALDMLRPVMDKLDSVVARVVTPLMAQLKKEMTSRLDAGALAPGAVGNGTATPGGAGGGGGGAGSTMSSTPDALPPTLPAKAANHIPPCLRNFAHKVDGARKVLEYICKDCKEDGESWTASVVVSIIWKGLCVISAKYGSSSQTIHVAGRPPSPESMARALASLAKDAQPTPPPPSGAIGKMASILPTRSASRPPSPPKGKFQDLPTQYSKGLPPTAITLASFEALIHRLVNGLVQKPSTPSEIAAEPDAVEHLAREALGEALEAITSMRMFVTALERGHEFMATVFKNLRDDVAMPTDKEEEILDAAEDAPPVLLFHLLAKKINKWLPANSRVRGPAQILGLTEDEYERQILAGFGVAEERAKRVALAYKGEVERLSAEVEGEARGWLNVLDLALSARCDV